MSRQHIDYTVVGSDKDTGEEDATAIRPIGDGEPGNAATFKRPSENLRTRTEAVRTSVDNLNFIADGDRAFLLTGTGSITWAGLPTGTFSADQNITLKPFLAPAASSASRLIIGAGTASQITIRTRQDGLSGQPRAYSGANTISFDFTPVDTGTGVVVITVTGTPANNFHVQYDSNVTSGTTVLQMLHYLNNVTATAGGAAFVAAGLEAVVDGTGGANTNSLGPNGGPNEVGFPTPPAPIVGGKVATSGPEQAFRYMAGAADAEQHVITPAQITAFFADPLNQLIEGDVICLRYDDLVMNAYGGRLQSLNEAPESKALLAGLNLFLMRRFPERLPGALPIAAVVNGVLILVNNRSYASGEVGPVVTAGASYQGSPTPPNSWADGTAVSGPISFETALDTIIQTLGTKAGGAPGAIKVGFTPIGNIAANTVYGAIQELDSEKAGLALVNTFTRANTFSPGTATETAITATGNTTGAGVSATGGNSNGIGVIGQGLGNGPGIKGTGGGTSGTPGVSGIGGATDGVGVKGAGVGAGNGGNFTGGASGGGVTGTGGSSGGTGVTGTGGAGGGTGVFGVGIGATGYGGLFHNDTTAGTSIPAVEAISVAAGGAPGIIASGSGTYAGIVATGGTNGPGVRGVATGATGIGVQAEATNNNGSIAFKAFAGTAQGAAFSGNGGDAGGTGILAGGGQTSGSGVGGFIVGGLPSGHGVEAWGGGTGYAIFGVSLGSVEAGNFEAFFGGGAADMLRVAGYINLSAATNPVSTTGFTNRITPKNVCKAWGHIATDGAGNVSVTEGFNLGTPSIGSNVITIPFGSGGGMATTNYSVVGGQVIGSGSTSNVGVGFHTLATGSFKLSLFNTANSRQDPAAVIAEVMFQVFAAQ